MTKDQERQQALLECAEAVKALLINHGEFGASLLCMALEIISDGRDNEQSGKGGTI